MNQTNKITVKTLMCEYENIAAQTVSNKDELKKKVRSIMEPVNGLHQLSARNFMLAQAQVYQKSKEIEDVFGSYKALQSIGRQVKKGEKGNKILVPCFYKVKDDNGNETGEKRMYFRLGNTFGLSQTEGEQIDKIGLLKNKGLITYKDIEDRVTIPIKYTDSVLTHGSTDGKSINISQRNNDDQKLSTLLHELAHVRLGHFEPKIRDSLDRSVRECEAEAVAYMLTVAIGFENKKAEAYMANWNANEYDMKKSSIRVINTAFKITKELDLNGLLVQKNIENGYLAEAPAVI